MQLPECKNVLFQTLFMDKITDSIIPPIEQINKILLFLVHSSLSDNALQGDLSSLYYLVNLSTKLVCYMYVFVK